MKYQKIIIKIGTSSLVYTENGYVNLHRLEKIARVISDLVAQGKKVALVSSGAIGVGREVLGIRERPKTLPEKQMCAAVGQCKLITHYQRFFAEYNRHIAQVLMTNFNTKEYAENIKNVFNELFKNGIIPVVNENDAVTTEEIEFGDNDTLSARVCELIGADLLILLTDVDGLYDKNAEVVEIVDNVSSVLDLVQNSASDVGTGGMKTKLKAAEIANNAGCDMVIANSKDLDVIHKILSGEKIGTLFRKNS